MSKIVELKVSVKTPDEMSLHKVCSLIRKLINVGMFDAQDTIEHSLVEFSDENEYTPAEVDALQATRLSIISIKVNKK